MGETMARKILLDEIMRDSGDPPAELVVIGRSSESTEAEEMSDHCLREKIALLRAQINGGALTRKLPDNGEKLKVRLRAFEDALGKRGMTMRSREDDAMEGKRRAKAQGDNVFNVAEPSKFEKSSSQSHSPMASDFFSRFYTKLDADNKSPLAFSEELGSMHKGFRSPKQSKQPTFQIKSKLHLRSSSKSNTTAFDGLRSISRYYKDDSKISLLNFSLCNRRNRECQNPVSQCSTSNKAHDVVLLDEEDTENIHPVEDNELLNVKIYYPARDHADCVEIRYSDIKCLEPQSYVSSTIMNFFIQYLQKPMIPRGRSKGEYHFFNTYFYNKLVEALSGNGSRSQLSKLRRWFKGINLFQKAYIFVPVHGSLHWSLVIICFPAREDESGPIILHMDSLGFHDSKAILENIKRVFNKIPRYCYIVFEINTSSQERIAVARSWYLIEEWELMINGSHPVPLNLPISEETWRDLPNRIVKKNILVPQQKNEFDCGLFVLYFMERFIMEAPERVTKKGLDMFGHGWFHAEEASGLRKRLRELLMEEFESARFNNTDEEASPSSASSLEST